jgi:hypothetical protein
MALAGCCSFIPDMGHQLYPYEKRAAILFSLSAGFPQNTYFIFMPFACRTAQSSKIQ